jgi:glutaredoxin
VSLREGGRWRVLAVLAWLGMASVLASLSVRGEDSPPGAAAPVAVEVFVREGCPHCADAKSFLDRLRREQPSVVLTVRDVGRDSAALARLESLAAATPGRVASVPAFVIRGELLVGFADEATSGARLREMIAGAKPAGAR